MKKYIIIILASCTLGLIIGLYAAAQLFALNIDLLGIPYKNEPVTLLSDITINQGNISFVIPKGATITRDYTAKGTTYLSLQIIGAPMTEPPIESSGGDRLFFVKE